MTLTSHDNETSSYVHLEAADLDEYPMLRRLLGEMDSYANTHVRGGEVSDARRMMDDLRGRNPSAAPFGGIVLVEWQARGYWLQFGPSLS